ncbi:MAG: hypothetical protein MJ053_02685 [Elusimicrobiaceae bacterium]|nr:hypothetical protein [Elusimicrobiaceae bacterium]
MIAVCPLYAQGRGIMVGSKRAVTNTVAKRVSEQIARQTTPRTFSPTLTVAQIANLPGTPTVKVRQAGVFTVPAQGLQAQVVNGDTFLGEVFPCEDCRYLPQVLNSEAPAFFRGMALRHPNEIKNLLTNGVEFEKSSYSQLFFSNDIDVALAYANVEKTLIPVVVKVEATPDLLLWRPPHRDVGDYYAFSRDIPAKFVSDVMVFLEVNGERNWYKATLESNELILIPARTQIFQIDDLFMPELDLSSWKSAVFYH